MFIFAILFFGIMTDAGMLDPIIDGILRAVGSNPARIVMGTSLLALRRIDEAFVAIDRAIAIDPECADYPWNKALMQLLIGDFEGWRGREWGRKCALVNFVDRQFTKPQWFGAEPIAGNE